MIFQVLIVDDEPHVVESISALLEQSDRYELELHSAYHAQQAIEIMKQGRIDLLLTDIQLPGMDGLALVREVKQLWPNCTSVILSAYSEFQYAYEAIAQGVAGYILKTEEERDILARLNTILGQIEENLNHREWTTPAPSAMADDPLRQSRFIKLLYDAQITADAAKEALGQLGFEFSGGVLAPMMVQSRPDAVIDRALLLTALERYLGDKLQCIACAPLEPSTPPPDRSWPSCWEKAGAAACRSTTPLSSCKRRRHAWKPALKCASWSWKSPARPDR